MPDDELIERVAEWLFNRIKQERLVWAPGRVADVEWVDLDGYLKTAWRGEAHIFILEVGLG